MFYGEERQDHRQVLFAVWKKQQDGFPLEPMEKKIWHVINNHPEYHKIFEDEEKFLDKDFQTTLGETNPFLHLSLHLVLLEQIQTNQPHGITKLFQQAVERYMDVHEAEHCIMNSIALALHEVFQEQKQFDEKAYLKRIKVAIKNGYW